MNKELNIKCNNKSEAIFIINYLLNNGCNIDSDELSDFNKCKFEKPIILYNLPFNFKKIFFSETIYVLIRDYEITEAKYLMREEKLNKINKN